jgi:hypothetical protein
MRGMAKNSVKVVVGIEGDHVLTREMDLKPNDIRHLSMNIKLVDMMCGFGWRDVTAFRVPFNFVPIINFERCQVRSLLNVFEEVLQRSKGCGTFDINVTVKSHRKERTKRDNPSIVNGNISD